MCRLVSRARQHIGPACVDEDPRAVAPPGRRRALLDAFVAAARAGDLTGLERLLAEDVSRLSGGSRRGGGTWALDDGTATAALP